jgi:hypothetical protein
VLSSGIFQPAYAVKLKVEPNYMIFPSIITLIFLYYISLNCLQKSTFLILHDRLAFFIETKFVYVPAEVCVCVCGGGVVNNGVKKSHTPAKMGRLGKCGLVIYVVTFHNSNIQSKLILREKFIYVHTHTAGTSTIRNGLLQDVSPSLHL